MVDKLYWPELPVHSELLDSKDGGITPPAVAAVGGACGPGCRAVFPSALEGDIQVPVPRGGERCRQGPRDLLK